MHVSWYLATPFCSHIYSITFFFVTILYFVFNFTFTKKKYVKLRYFLKLRNICSSCFYSNVLLLHFCMPLRSTHFFRAHISVLCIRAIPVSWLGSGSCQARPSRLDTNEWWISSSRMSVHFERWVSVYYRYVYAWVCVYIGYIYIYINTGAKF